MIAHPKKSRITGLEPGSSGRTFHSRQSSLLVTSVTASIHGKPIRLTDERWTHITEEHSEVRASGMKCLKPSMLLSEYYLGTMVNFLLPGKSALPNFLSWCFENWKQTA